MAIVKCCSSPAKVSFLVLRDLWGVWRVQQLIRALCDWSSDQPMRGKEGIWRCQQEVGSLRSSTCFLSQKVVYKHGMDEWVHEGRKHVGVRLSDTSLLKPPKINIMLCYVTCNVGHYHLLDEAAWEMLRTASRGMPTWTEEAPKTSQKGRGTLILHTPRWPFLCSESWLN